MSPARFPEIHEVRARALVAALVVAGFAVVEVVLLEAVRWDWPSGTQRDWPALPAGLVRAAGARRGWPAELAGLVRAAEALSVPAGAGLALGRVAVGCLWEGLAHAAAGEPPARLARTRPGWVVHAGA